MPSKLRALVVGFGVLALAAVGVAQAQTVSKCDSAKYKEAGKKVFCLLKVNSKAAKTGTTPDPTAITKCQTKFDDKCAKAETKGDCTETGNCAALEDAADSAWGALVDAVTASPSGAFVDVGAGLLD